MKISIMTIHYIHNYGSVLQTYATQYLFEKAGYDVQTVDYVRPNCRRENVLADQYKRDQQNGSIRSYPIIRSILSYKRKYHVKRCDSVFHAFIVKYIHLSQTYDTAESLMQNPPIADVYCTGSDQMWNSIWNDGILKEHFLAYAPAGKKRIAFSTSFGRTELDKSELETTRPFIQKYDAISVREKSALDLLEQMDYKNGVHILDPTLIMTADEWASQLSIIPIINCRYVLTYGLNENHELGKFAQKVAKDNGLRLINIGLSRRAYFNPGKTVLLPSVETFLALIKYADYIVTDSFHGTAFSLNFNKQFFVFYPGRFSTRLQSILALTHQEQRVVSDSNTDWKEITPIDYTVVNPILAQERQKAWRFIEEI